MSSWLRSLFGRKPETDGVDVDIMWGGCYVSRETDGQFGVFRLLDFSQTAYHAALFREKFAEVPTLAEVTALTPGIMHVPMDARGLLSPPIQLIGSSPLTADSLGGYMVYLEHHGATSEDREKLTAKLIGFSQEVPLRLKLRTVGDQLQIAQRV